MLKCNLTTYRGCIRLELKMFSSKYFDISLRILVLLKKLFPIAGDIELVT